MTQDINNMNFETKGKRTSIYIDEALIKKAEILYGEAGVSTFSQFVRKAVENYIDQLILGQHSPQLTAALRQAVAEEVKPIASRLSKGLYRYAVELDMMTQLMAKNQLPKSAFDELWHEANYHVSKSRGRLDLDQVLTEERYRFALAMCEEEQQREQEQEMEGEMYE